MGISLGKKPGCVSPGAGQSALTVSHWSDSSRVLWTERCLVTLAAERHRMRDVWPGSCGGNSSRQVWVWMGGERGSDEKRMEQRGAKR